MIFIFSRLTEDYRHQAVKISEHCLVFLTLFYLEIDPCNQEAFVSLKNNFSCMKIASIYAGQVDQS